MSDSPSRADRTWPIIAVCALAAALLIAGLFSFVIAPIMEAKGTGVSPWAAICRSMGLQREAAPPTLVVAGAPTASTVVFDPAILGRITGANRETGGQLAAACSACHGQEGVSENAQFPTLAGQSAEALYKELRDFKSGARTSPIMAPLVANLTDAQMIDLAAYFSRDKAFAELGRRWPVPDSASQTLVQRGDPARNLPACDACHRPGAGGPIETPALDGQHQEYLLLQLGNFSSGARRNDIYGRMRDVAGKLTPAEQAAVAEYYQGLR